MDWIKTIISLIIIIISIVFITKITKKGKANNARNNVRIAENQERLKNLQEKDIIIKGNFGSVSDNAWIAAVVCFLLAFIQFLITWRSLMIVGCIWCILFIILAIMTLKTSSSLKNMWQTAVFYVTCDECVLKTTNKNYTYVIPITSIETVTINKQALMILASGDNYSIPYLNNILDVKEVIEKIKNGETVVPMEDSNATHTVAQTSYVQTADNIEKIKKLKELLDEGIITEDEFEAKKKQLFDLI